MSNALARWRQCRAVELVLEGKKYDEVARQVGYANRGTAIERSPRRCRSGW